MRFFTTAVEHAQEKMFEKAGRSYLDARDNIENKFFELSREDQRKLLLGKEENQKLLQSLGHYALRMLMPKIVTILQRADDKKEMVLYLENFWSDFMDDLFDENEAKSRKKLIDKLEDADWEDWKIDIISQMYEDMEG